MFFVCTDVDICNTQQRCSISNQLIGQMLRTPDISEVKLKLHLCLNKHIIERLFTCAYFMLKHDVNPFRKSLNILFPGWRSAWGWLMTPPPKITLMISQRREGPTRATAPAKNKIYFLELQAFKSLAPYSKCSFCFVIL
jgi:hypothetical protein